MPRGSGRPGELAITSPTQFRIQIPTGYTITPNHDRRISLARETLSQRCRGEKLLVFVSRTIYRLPMVVFAFFRYSRGYNLGLELLLEALSVSAGDEARSDPAIIEGGGNEVWLRRSSHM